MQNKYDALLLFSGGLDSILAAKMLQAQGLKVLCLHFTSPFFGQADKTGHWEKIWNLEIRPFDISAKFCTMLAQGPPHGFGSALNPCVDCKIMLLSRAKELLNDYGAKFLATGEVLGQRPMSQRRDSLDLIQNKAGVKGLLLRPLCALRLPQTPMEESGLVNRELLGSIQGRGRNEQLALAQKFNLTEIPAPAGGCVLTEKENARRFWQIIKRLRGREKSEEDLVADFRLGRMGRQFWLNEGEKQLWLCLGRNSEDNQNLRAMAGKDDLTLKLCDYSGPFGLARGGASWSENALRQACAILASYSKNAAQKGEARVSIFGAQGKRCIKADVKKLGQFSQLPDWEQVRMEIRLERKKLESQKEKEDE